MSTPRTTSDIERLLTEVRHLAKRTTADRIWDATVKFMVPVVLAVVGWGIILEVRVSIIESSRFTNRDAAELEARIKSGIPPGWLKEQVEEIKQRLQRLEDKVAK
jgi:hypothetical protein